MLKVFHYLIYCSPLKHIKIIESQTMVLKGSAEHDHSIFMSPSWREGVEFSVKQWNPTGNDGLSIDLRPFKGDTSLHIEIGAENNTLIKVVYHSFKTGLPFGTFCTIIQ
jgi:hypothetical protein